MMAEVIIQREAASTSATSEEDNRFKEAVGLNHMNNQPFERRFFDHGLNIELRDRSVPPPQLQAASRPRKDTPTASSLQGYQLPLVESTMIGSSKRKNSRPKRLVRP